MNMLTVYNEKTGSNANTIKSWLLIIGPKDKNEVKLTQTTQ